MLYTATTCSCGYGSTGESGCNAMIISFAATGRFCFGRNDVTAYLVCVMSLFFFFLRRSVMSFICPEIEYNHIIKKKNYSFLDSSIEFNYVVVLISANENKVGITNLFF